MKEGKIRNQAIYKEVKGIPFTPEELKMTAHNVKIGDRIYKRVPNMEWSQKKGYLCIVLDKYPKGVLVKKELRRGIWIKDFIHYTDIAAYNRNKKKEWRKYYGQEN